VRGSSSLFVARARLLTPSPVAPRLMKTPVSRHPLPQGGEGGNSRSDASKCRNSRERLRLSVVAPYA
jgi:hypothetical protein